jgi:zinc ribbon protein
MYCPTCGVQNQDGIKFCTRCGTNLGVVTSALANKTENLKKWHDDDRKLKTISNYYKGRRDTITGAVLIPAGLLAMAIMTLAGVPRVAAFWIISWMFFWGAPTLAIGLGKWIAARDEMKMMGYVANPGSQQALGPPPIQQSLPDYSTGSAGYPGGVTEQTTRHLDDRGYAPPVERQRE